MSDPLLAERKAPGRRTISALVAALLAVTIGVPTVDARPVRPRPSPEATRLKDLQAAREKLKETQAQKAGEVDVLKATDEDLSQALDQLETNVGSQSSLLQDAQTAQAQAEADAALAQQQLDASQVELEGLRGSIKDEAVAAYTGGSQDNRWAILSSADPNDAVARRAYLEIQSARGQDAAERYRSVQEDLTLQREAKSEAAARAQSKKNEATRRLGDLRASQARQEKIQVAVDDRIDRALSEADSLAAFDQNLSAEISSSQSRLAAQLAAQRAAAQASAARRGSRSSQPLGTARSFATTGGSGIASANGIRVAASIAPALSALLAAAQAAGINIGGSGFRDPGGQIAVRRNNCGSSSYAIYQAPASSCRPPTARPGTSQHEVGLAIDFTQDGRVLNRGSSAYGWLQANAAGFGFYNLPGEPWHWSTTGK